MTNEICKRHIYLGRETSMRMGREAYLRLDDTAPQWREPDDRVAPFFERRLVLIEPRQIFLQCLTEVLSGPGSRFNVSGYTSWHEMGLHREDYEALGFLLSVPSDSASLEDLAELIEAGRRDFPTVPIIVLAESEEPDFIRVVIGLGARGYVPASFSVAALKEVIFLVHAGEIFVPASVIRHDLDEMKMRVSPGRYIAGSGQASIAAPESSIVSPPADDMANLTRREREVLRLVKDGKPNKLIARELMICEGTVKAHVQRIMRKMQVQNRTQVALAAADLTILR
jgi:DNA-binding NarL/FixJ family response regulator